MSKTLALPRLIGATALVLCALASAAGLPAAALAAPGPVALKVTPSPAAFATTVVGQKSPLEIDVLNEGEGAAIEKVVIEGAEPGEFSGGGSNCGPLGEGQHCTIAIDFAPNSSGEKHATVFIRFSGGERAEESFELVGTAVTPHVSFSPASFDFGVQETNSNAGSTVFQVENDSGAVEQINSVDLSGGNNNGFWFGNSDCWGRTMQPGETCSVEVWFGPNGTGSFQNQLRVNVNGEDFTADLSGIGARPEIEATPNPVDFGAAGVGLAGVTRTVTMTNVGLVPGAFFIAIVSGGDSGSFRLLDESCTGIEIGVGDTCTAHVRFSPLAAGPHKATLAMFGNNDGPMQIPLSGEGVAPALTLSPASLDFGPQAVGSKGAPRTFSLRNDGGVPVDLGAATLAGADLDQFTLSGDDCAGTTLGAGEECRLRVRFAPDSGGAKSARLRVAADGASLSSSLTGTGTSAPAAASRVYFHWRGVGHRRPGRVLRAGRARCAGAKGCVVTVTTKLNVVRHPRPGLVETQVASLPRLHLRIGANRSRPLDLPLSAAALELLAHGRASLDVKARWTTGASSGRDAHSASVR